MERITYLDNNATTKVDEAVFEAMQPFFCEQYGNPSSMHSFGGNVAKNIKKARNQVACLLGASEEREIIFTGCGSESSNMAIRGVLEVNKDKKTHYHNKS
jgi:cysteine desulfurase